jgi:hypothetical protein
VAGKVIIRPEWFMIDSCGRFAVNTANRWFLPCQPGLRFDSFSLLVISKMRGIVVWGNAADVVPGTAVSGHFGCPEAMPSTAGYGVCSNGAAAQLALPEVLESLSNRWTVTFQINCWFSAWSQ